MITISGLCSMNVGDSFTGEPLLKGLPAQNAVRYVCLSVDTISNVELTIMLGVYVYDIFLTKLQVQVEGEDVVYTEVVPCL